MAKNEIIYKNLDSLKSIENSINEAKKALQDSSRTIESSDIPEILGATTGIATGGAISYAALVYGGTTGLSAAGITSGLAAAGAIVGGGMVAGIGVLAAPITLLGIGGYAFVRNKNNKKLLERKEILLKEAGEKLEAIEAMILKEAKGRQKNMERKNYLQSIVFVLKAIITDLRVDLEIAGVKVGISIGM